MFSMPKEAWNIIYSAFKGCTMIYPVNSKPCIKHIGNIGGIDYANVIEWRFAHQRFINPCKDYS